MWTNAEVVALIDEQGYVRVISRNEEEAPIKDAIGMCIIEDRLLEICKPAARKAFHDALAGKEVRLEVGSIADDGHVYWSKVKVMPSPINEFPVLLHARRLPRSWNSLSPREKELIHTLHEASMNPKIAAKRLGITLNTFNAHRRAIGQKCNLRGVGDFWVFVERCR